MRPSGLNRPEVLRVNFVYKGEERFPEPLHVSMHKGAQPVEIQVSIFATTLFAKWYRMCK